MSRATAIIEGNVGREPEIRFSENGKAWMKFSVAVTERTKGDDGQWGDGITSWYDVVTFGRLAEASAETLTKGCPVLVTGRLHLDKWTDKEDVERTTAVIRADSVGLVPKAQPAKTNNKGREEEPPF